jgi:hypothetical protein
MTMALDAVRAVRTSNTPSGRKNTKNQDKHVPSRPKRLWSSALRAAEAAGDILLVGVYET